jgi:hypothetical protein
MTDNGIMHCLHPSNKYWAETFTRLEDTKGRLLLSEQSNAIGWQWHWYHASFFSHYLASFYTAPLTVLHCMIRLVALLTGNGPEGNFAERIAQFRKQSGTLSDTTAASVSPTSNNDTAYSTATVDMADVAPDADLRSKEGINPAGTVDMADVAPDADLRTKLYINPAGTVDMADVAPNADLRNKGTDRAISDSDRSAVKSAASQGRDKAPEPAKGDDKTEAQPAPVRRFSNATADQRTGERKRLAAERKRVANERDAAQRAAVLQRHVSYQEAQKRKADAKGQGRLQQQNKEAKLTQQAAQHVQSKRAPGGDTDDETVAASEVEAGDPASDVNEAAQQSRLGTMPSSDAANEGGARSCGVPVAPNNGWHRCCIASLVSLTSLHQYCIIRTHDVHVTACTLLHLDEATSNHMSGQYQAN